MKKILIALVISLFTLAQVEAQVSVRPGIRGGVNFAHYTEADYNDSYFDVDNNQAFTNLDEYSSRTDFYLGFYAALKLSKFYTLQPEIDYTRQGSKFEFTDSNNIRRTTNFEMAYISLGVVNKFTFNKFNIHVGPTIDFIVEDNYNTDSEIDLAFLIGAGYDITKNFGLEARIKKGVIPVLDFGNNNHTNVVFSVGATYTFDVK